MFWLGLTNVGQRRLLIAECVFISTDFKRNRSTTVRNSDLSWRERRITFLFGRFVLVFDDFLPMNGAMQCDSRINIWRSPIGLFRYQIGAFPGKWRTDNCRTTNCFCFTRNYLADQCGVLTSVPGYRKRGLNNSILFFLTKAVLISKTLENQKFQREESCKQLESYSQLLNSKLIFI